MKTVLEMYLGSCVAHAVRRERPRIIAVAGSVGKSSTKHAIGIALGAETDPQIRVSAKNYNNQLGVPLTILNRPAPGRSVTAWFGLLCRATCLRFGLVSIGVRTLVLELGTDHPGDLEYLCRIAPPDIAVLTAIGAEHTEFFGTVDKVAREELAIIENMTPGGIAILNADDTRVLQAKNMVKGSVVTFGENVSADVRLVSTKVVVDEMDPRASGLDVQIVALGLSAHVRLQGTFGKPQAFAVAAALALTHALDVDFHEAAERLQSFRGMPGRTRLIEGIKHTMLLDDSYNSSPLAALSAVRDLAAFPLQPGARRIAAMGDMLELGALAKDAHVDLGRAIAEADIDMLVACGTLAHVVVAAAVQAGMSEDSVFVFATSAEAGLFIQQRLRSGDVVLIKGSQGARMEKITKELMAEPLQAEQLLVRQSSDWLT